MEYAYREQDYARAEAALQAAAHLKRSSGPDLEQRRLAVLRQLISIPWAIETASRSQALFEIAQDIFLSGRGLINAIEPAALSVQFARLAGDKEALCSRLLFQGALLVRRNNFEDGIEALSEAYRLARDLGRAALEGRALSNIGLAMFTLHRYHDALSVFGLALDAASREAQVDVSGAAQRRGAALTNMALCYYELRNYDAGLVAAGEASNLIGEPVDQRTAMARSLSESILAKHLLAHVSAALQRLSARHALRPLPGLASSGTEPSRLAHFVPYLDGINGQLLDRARQAAVSALTYARRAGSVEALFEAEAINCLLESFVGNADVAETRLRSLLERSVDMVETHRSLLITASAVSQAKGSPNALAYHAEFAHRARQAFSRSARLPQAPVEFVTAKHDPGELEQVLGESSVAFRAFLERSLSTDAEFIVLAIQAEARQDPDGLHIFRVGCLSALLAAELKLAFGEDLRKAARLHDIGMIKVPGSIQSKTGRLTPQEFELVRGHPLYGLTLLSNGHLSYAALAAEVVGSHHERWDGKGYPQGLRAESIPLSARIVAIADAFDCMTHERPSAPARHPHVALGELRAHAGRHFDPNLVPVFCALVERLLAEHPDLDAFLSVDGANTPAARVADLIGMASRSDPASSPRH